MSGSAGTSVSHPGDLILTGNLGGIHHFSSQTSQVILATSFPPYLRVWESSVLSYSMLGLDNHCWTVNASSVETQQRTIPTPVFLADY